MSHRLVKVLVRKDEDVETAWCVRVKRDGRTLYRLANILFLHASPAWGDLIEAAKSADEGGHLTFKKIVETSGRSTMIVDYEKVETFHALTKFLAKSFDVVTEGCFGPDDRGLGRAYLAVPKDITLAALFEIAHERFPELVPIHPKLTVDVGARRKKAKKVHRPPDLHSAARDGKLDVVKRLIASGQEVDARDPHGRTPLFIAVLEGRHDIVRFLLAKGADVDAETERGSTPLVGAAMRGRAKEAQVLLDAGARVDVGDGIDAVLAQAAYRGSTGVVRALLDHSPHLDKGWALLEAAAEGYLPIVKLLVASGADPEWRASRAGSDALTLARKRKHREVIAFLTNLRRESAKAPRRATSRPRRGPTRTLH